MPVTLPTWRARLILVGAGHAHLTALSEWRRRGGPDADVLLIDPFARWTYSGLAPAIVAGEIKPEAAEIDLRDLALAAGARFEAGRVVRIDAAERRVILGDGQALPYDVVSLNAADGPDLSKFPGARDHAIPVRPLDRIIRWRREASAVAALKIVMVGGGLAGCELAAALARGLPNAQVTLVEAEGRLASGRSRATHAAILKALVREGVEVRLGVAAVRLEKREVWLSDGARLGADAVFWAAGERAPVWLASLDAGLDADGRVKVRNTLQARRDKTLFAAGRCAGGRWGRAPAGLTSVRHGEALAVNLARAVARKRVTLEAKRGEGLSLIQTSAGSAIWDRNGLAIEGRWAFDMKRSIDAAFVRRLRGG